MAKITPGQVRYIDPATQTLLQFDTPETDYFLSKVNNLTLNSIGHDLVLAGFNIENPVTDISFTGNSVTVTLTNGYVLIDDTVVHVTDSDITITFTNADNPLYLATGKFIIHCNFQFLQTPQLETQFEIRMSWIDSWTSGSPASQILPHGWQYQSDRIILHSFSFTKSGNNITSVTWDSNTNDPTEWPKYIDTFGPFYSRGRYYDETDQNNSNIHLWELIEYVHNRLGAPDHDLDHHSDVTITSPPTDGDLIVYDTGQWINTTIDLDSLSDVTITLPVNGHLLVYNAGQWINTTIDLDSLSDVTITLPTDGEFLKYDTGQWINTVVNLEDLNDVGPLSPNDGSLLVYNSSPNQWETIDQGHTNGLDADTVDSYHAEDLLLAGPSITAILNQCAVVGPFADGIFICAVDSSGTPVDADGYVIYNGTKYTVPRHPAPPSLCSIESESIGSDGYFVFDTVGSSVFTIAGNASRLAFARPRADGDWEYDNALPIGFGFAWVTFSPIPDRFLAIGAATKTFGSDVFTSAEVWTEVRDILHIDHFFSDIVSGHWYNNGFPTETVPGVWKNLGNVTLDLRDGIYFVDMVYSFSVKLLQTFSGPTLTGYVRVRKEHLSDPRPDYDIISHVTSGTTTNVFGRWGYPWFDATHPLFANYSIPAPPATPITDPNNMANGQGYHHFMDVEQNISIPFTGSPAVSESGGYGVSGIIRYHVEMMFTGPGAIVPSISLWPAYDHVQTGGTEYRPGWPSLLSCRAHRRSLS